MPYVHPGERADLDRGEPPINAGELNYVITRAIRKHLGDAPRYADFNEAIGVLECAKLELYRRMVAPYEDAKKEENGDVYV